MEPRDLNEDVRIPSRSGSSVSLASQSSHYTDQLDEDLSTIIAEYDSGAEKENVYGIHDTLSDAPSTAQPYGKRKRAAEEESREAPLRQVRRTTQEDAQTSSEGSKDTLLDSASSAGPSNNSSRTLLPTPPTFGHRPKPVPREHANIRPSPPPITKAAPPIPSARPSILVTAPAKPVPPLAPVAVPPATTATLPPILPPAPHLSAVPVPPRTAVPVSDAPFIVPPEWRAPEPVVVAYSGPYYEQYLGRLPWGAQWELARYINRGFDLATVNFEKVSKLREQRKTAAAAEEVKKLVEETKKGGPAVITADDQFATAYARELSTKLPWDELDKEERILHDYPLGGVGCNQGKPFCADDPDWYGGRVHFTARLQEVDIHKGEFKLELDRPVLGTSNRFARRFGSRRFIRIRIPQELLMSVKGDELSNYFRRPFIIGSAVFRAFYAKEKNVFLFRTNEEVVGNGRDGTLSVMPSTAKCTTSQSEYSLTDLLNWHNALELNSEQTMVKWTARFALGLSNSVPGVRLELANVRFIDDTICDAFKGPGKPPSEMQMTDGCGFANRALMRDLEAKFPAWREEPTAIQCRIAGAKGLLCVYHDLTPKEEEAPAVWLRPSQIKIMHTSSPLHTRILPADADPALLTVDVLRASRMNTPARLAVETITNLAENGVPYNYFVDLCQAKLTERLDKLLLFNPDDPKSMQHLWNAVAREGSVINQRMARQSAGIARAAGLFARDYDDDQDDEDEDGLDALEKALREQSSAWWDDPVSGCPSGLEETCLTLIDAGFTPQTCPVLRAKLMEVAKKVVTTFKTKYRFAVPMSCSAFIVPDPYGVLGPNEIHVKCSRRDFVDQEGRQTDIVLGDVLVTRHPCKVPSDVQKVKAVFHERLRHYCNVIVVSTKSHTYQGVPLDRHLASLTGGGDYDGDTMEVFWDPALVRAFKEPDPRIFAVEPPEVQQCLKKNTETVSAFLARVPSSAPEEYRISALQDYLLAALRGSAYVSTYSIWWEKSTYSLGYQHKDTIFLAYMFCAILDGSKTGVTIDPAAFAKHKATWNSGKLGWKDEKHDCPLVKRDNSLGYFIMDTLSKHVHFICEQHRLRIEPHLGPLPKVPLDQDLARPYLDAERTATELLADGQPSKFEELQRIKKHVEEMYAKVSEAKSIAAAPAKKLRGGKGSNAGASKSPFTDLPIERRQDILRERSKEFHAGPTGLRCFDDPTAIKASYAYYYDHERARLKWSRFPWDVAMRALCEIKAKARGGSKTLSGDFYPWMTISPAYLR